MKLLAIDSSGMPASAAVLEDGTLLAEYTVNFKMTHSQTLVPMLDEIRSMLHLDLDSLDAIAVAGGPGSFTGLRIGSAAAKGIGLALKKPLIHVPTLEGMAYHFYGSEELIVPMIDARNRQVFAGIYTFRREEADRPFGSAVPDQRKPDSGDSIPEQPEFRDPLVILMDQAPVTVEALCWKLNGLAQETGKTIVLCGDGAHAYREIIKDALNVPCRFSPAHLAQQKAGAVAVRGMDLACLGKTETAAEHRPDYLRVSQAERMRAGVTNG